MDPFQLLTLSARIGLAATFAVAAVAKLRDHPAARRATLDLGVGPQLAPVIAGLLPVIELGTAAGLLVTASSGWAASVAGLLLVAFSVATARSLRRGRRPSCGCFGSASPTPIGRHTLTRNGLLAMGAVVVAVRVAAGGTAAAGAYGDLTPRSIAAVSASALVVAALAVQTWLIVHLVHQQGRLVDRLDAIETHAGSAGSSSTRTMPASRHRRRHGPAIGSPAPRFGLRAADDGAAVSIDDLLADGRPQVLLFLEPGCEACLAMAAELEAIGTPAPARAVVGIVRGGANEVLARFHPDGFDHLLVDESGAVAQQYGVQGTPSAVVVLPDGRVGSALAEGRAAARRLVGGARRDDPHDDLRHEHEHDRDHDRPQFQEAAP